MQVIGLIRFSYPSTTAFQIRLSDSQKQEEYLFSEARMTERFALFEHICLPAMRRQTDPDFALVVVIGDVMPAHHRTRLENLLTGIPQCTLLSLPSMPHREAMALAVDGVKKPGRSREWVAHFRLDDDDAVAFDFVAGLREQFALLRKIAVSENKLGLDYNHGITIQANVDGVSTHAGHQRLWTPAQAIYLPRDDPRTIVDFPHHKLDKVMPVVTLPSPKMFVRSYNRHNDSHKSSYFKMKFQPVSPAHTQQLKNQFGISVSALAEATKTL